MNRILDSLNDPLGVTNYDTSTSTVKELQGVPLGTSDNSATGVIGVKVLVVANTSSASPTYTPNRGALTDRSGTITAGGTAQTIAAANTSRSYLFFQNHSDIDMWLNFGVTAVATQPSIFIAAGGNFSAPSHFIPTGLVSIIGATTGKAFTCKEA